jgi:hypothetical protein
MDKDQDSRSEGPSMLVTILFIGLVHLRQPESGCVTSSMASQTLLGRDLADLRFKAHCCALRCKLRSLALSISSSLPGQSIRPTRSESLQTSEDEIVLSLNIVRLGFTASFSSIGWPQTQQRYQMGVTFLWAVHWCLSALGGCAW